MINHSTLLQTILSPKITEKTVFANEKSNITVFKVMLKANKLMVKKAVEVLFEVKVLQVRILNVKGKPRRSGRIKGRTKDWKKAYVTLKSGYNIQFSDNELT